MLFWKRGCKGRRRLYLVVGSACWEEGLEGRTEAHDVKKTTRHEALEHHHHGVLEKGWIQRIFNSQVQQEAVFKACVWFGAP